MRKIISSTEFKNNVPALDGRKPIFSRRNSRWPVALSSRRGCTIRCNLSMALDAATPLTGEKYRWISRWRKLLTRWRISVAHEFPWTWRAPALASHQRTRERANKCTRTRSFTFLRENQLDDIDGVSSAASNYLSRRKLQLEEPFARQVIVLYDFRRVTNIKSGLHDDFNVLRNIVTCICHWEVHCCYWVGKKVISVWTRR